MGIARKRSAASSSSQTQQQLQQQQQQQQQQFVREDKQRAALICEKYWNRGPTSVYSCITAMNKENPNDPEQLNDVWT